MFRRAIELAGGFEAKEVTVLLGALADLGVELWPEVFTPTS